MPTNFEVRIDKIRLRGITRSIPVLQEKYIARSGCGAYIAVAASAENAINDILRTMRMHYRRLGIADSMGERILKALHTPVERIPGAANDIRAFPVTLLNS